MVGSFSCFKESHGSVLEWNYTERVLYKTGPPRRREWSPTWKCISFMRWIFERVIVCECFEGRDTVVTVVAVRDWEAERVRDSDREAERLSVRERERERKSICFFILSFDWGEKKVKSRSSSRSKNGLLRIKLLSLFKGWWWSWYLFSLRLTILSTNIRGGGCIAQR